MQDELYVYINRMGSPDCAEILYMLKAKQIYNGVCTKYYLVNIANRRVCK